MDVRDYLPIGSVVLLRSGIKKVMVTGMMPRVSQEEQIMQYDYIGVLYPEGFIDTDSMVLFNHDMINDIIFKGYDNPERKDFLNFVQENLDADK